MQMDRIAAICYSGLAIVAAGAYLEPKMEHKHLLLGTFYDQSLRDLLRRVYGPSFLPLQVCAACFHSNLTNRIDSAKGDDYMLM